MTIDDVLTYFVKVYRLTKKTGIAQGTVTNWKKKGYIPIETQMRLEKLTNGDLKADLAHCVYKDRKERKKND